MLLPSFLGLYVPVFVLAFSATIQIIWFGKGTLSKVIREVFPKNGNCSWLLPFKIGISDPHSHPPLPPLKAKVMKNVRMFLGILPLVNVMADRKLHSLSPKKHVFCRYCVTNQAGPSIATRHWVEFSKNIYIFGFT